MTSSLRPSRFLVVLPSWVGDAVMATPTLRILREALPGALIGALMRPGIDEVLAGLDLFDQAHVDRAAGMMGPKRVAAKLRLARYDAALILTNSFSTALIARLAAIPRRVGYARDGRAMLLTDGLPAPRRRDVEPYSRSSTRPGAWAPVPAVEYYHRLATFFLESIDLGAPPPGPLELAVTPEQEAAAEQILGRASIDTQRPIALLNPGANDPAKRWPADRFARLADHLASARNMSILIAGSPGEAGLARDIASRCAPETAPARLPDLGVTLGALKGIIRRCALLVTNDTGPRHIGAAFSTPTVALFGPTDHRWTTLRGAPERIILADPTLPEEEVANDHPDRCAIERIELQQVIDAAESLLGDPTPR